MEETAMLNFTRTSLLTLALLAAGCCDGTTHRAPDTRTSTATAEPIAASYPVIVQIVSSKDQPAGQKNRGRLQPTTLP